MRMDSFKRMYTWTEVEELIKTIGREAHLAERIQTERLNRGMSQEKLSKAMADAGCPMPQSAISKIENPAPGGRRAITVDEAIALSKVLDIPLNFLVLPPSALDDLTTTQRVAELPADWNRAHDALRSVKRGITWVAHKTADDPRWGAYFEGELQTAKEALASFEEEHPDPFLRRTKQVDEHNRLLDAVSLFEALLDRRRQDQTDA